MRCSPDWSRCSAIRKRTSFREWRTDEKRSTYRPTSDCNDSIVEGLAQDLQNVAAELRQFIEEQNPMVRQRHFSRHRHLAPTGSARHRRSCGEEPETDAWSPVLCGRR